MAKEIERKFLVKDNSYIAASTSSHHIIQAYLARMDRGVVRVRIMDDRAYLTVKSRNTGMSRDEWEYEIAPEDARSMIDKICEGGVIDKTRYIVPYEGYRWEVDAFHGHLEGLVVAEVELPDEKCQPPLPPFTGREVTGERRFYNSVLMTQQRP
ncbi:MAG: CYTH domain-containing protein [Candidatus Amulumruptor caecigallinarius]|nr:CYTH domain-containing protein [Candidatus Amulumruptor caecigallinarius]MCM1396194.1 CYTH domain-containing protein [Candidatus Amulumruptor caecigallinarius]MCM1453806.1 CYTH domain-containing protein [bacterium]